MKKRKNKLWLCGAAAVLVMGLWHGQDVRAGAIGCGDLWLMGTYRWLVAAVLAGLVVLGMMLCGENSGAAQATQPSDASRRKSSVSRKAESESSEIQRKQKGQRSQERRLGWCDWKTLWKVSGKFSGKLEQVYLAAGLILGTLYLLVLPPLSAPDEISHYVSAYQLSSRMLGQPATARSGRVLLRPQDVWVEDLEGIMEYAPDEDGNLEYQAEEAAAQQTVPLGDTLDESMYELLHEVGFSGQYAPERTVSFGGVLVSSTFPPVVTTPLAYVPQALGIALGRLLNGNTLALLYLGRFFNLIFFAVMTYLAMGRMPFGKEVLFGVAMLPMTLHLSASFSYDVMIMACLFCFTAICLDLAYGREKVRFLDVLLLAALMAVCGPCKMVYAPMMGLCLLIPVKKFAGGGNGWLRWALAALIVGGAWAVAMVLVNSQVLASYATATEAESYVQWAAEPGYSLTLLIHQPIRLFRMFYQTLLWQGEHYHLTMIGAWLGNLDEVLDVPYLVVMTLTVCLLGLAFRKPGETLEMSVGQRTWIGVICAGCGAVTMLSMLIAWTPLSARVINGVQGRYFLPFLPVLLLALKNDTVVLTKNGNRSILYFMCCLNGYVLLRLYSIVCLRL